MVGRHYRSTRGRHASPEPQRRLAGWVIAAGSVIVVACAATAVLNGPHADHAATGAARGGPAAAAMERLQPAGGTSRSIAQSITPAAKPTYSNPATATPPARTTRPKQQLRALTVRINDAVTFAGDHGLHAGLAVLDLTTGRYRGAGADTELFGSASVAKVLIAARLLSGPTSSNTVSRTEVATMIRTSDDALATQLWPVAGGSSLINDVERQFGITGLGTPNLKPGFWGNTHVTAKGLVKFYAAATRDTMVGPALTSAMRTYTRIAADGTDQHFGLAIAKDRPAIKQGWASGSADVPGDSTVNSTGIVDNGRFAVAILTEGSAHNAENQPWQINATQRDIVTQMARILMPSGTLLGR